MEDRTTMMFAGAPRNEEPEYIEDNTTEQVDIVVDEVAEKVQVEKETEKSLIPEKEIKMRLLGDAFDISKLISSYTPEKTITMPLVVQGIKLETEVYKMSELYDIATSENGRIKVISLIFDKLTSASKKIFDNKFENFLEAVSVYDLDYFYSVQIESWEDGVYEFECNNKECKHTIEFNKPLKELKNTSNFMKERLSKISKGETIDMFQLPEESQIKINENISFGLGVPSLEKFVLLNESSNVSEITYERLLHLDSIIFVKENSVLPFKPSYLNYFIDFLEKTRLPSDYTKQQNAFFEDLDVHYEGKVKCPHCGYINDVVKTDLLKELITSGLG